MGLISLIFDCVVISSVCAGARRTTGINVGQKVVDMVKNEKALTLTKGFFNVGEWVVDKGINYARRKIIQNNLNEFKDFTATKPNQSNIQQHGNTYQHQNHQSNQYMPNNNNNINNQPPQNPPQNNNNSYRF